MDDDDPDAEQGASQIFKTAFITVVFSSCYYQTKTTTLSEQPTKLFIQPPDVSKPVVVIKKKKKTIYLTFDDGPNKGTKKVMHIAEEENVPITMFIIGEHVYGSSTQKEVWDSIVKCGLIEICNHSYTHAHNKFQKFYEDPDSVENDFTRCADSLNITNKICRTPGRNIWRTQNVTSTDIKKSNAAADTLYKQGYHVVGWDLEWHYDGNLKLQNTADSLVKQIDSVFKKKQTKTPDHLVLLAHDQVYEDASDSTELRSLIGKLKANDEYEFEVISKYPGVKK